MPPKGHLNLANRLAEITAEDENSDIMQPIDIGLPVVLDKDSSTSGNRRRRRKDGQLEEAARKNTLLVPLDEVEKEWLIESGSSSIINIALHYNIFKDLFTEPHFFHPVVPLDLFFAESDADGMPIEEEDGTVFVSPIYFGNTLPAIQASQPPHLRFASPSVAKDSFWTLVMTSPDEHLQDAEKEYLHWMITNIPVGEDDFSNIQAGEVICPYLQPIPPRGTGYHRYVFVLYHHEKPIDFSSEKRAETCPLQERTFSTYDFYRRHEEQITPGGLAFFQSTWDPSVQLTFHHSLDMAEPSFEYEWPREYREPQVRFPKNEAFDKYLDKYRDTKDINEEVLRERLKIVHPFKDSPERLKYPNAVPFPRKFPTWLADKEKLKRMRQGIWKDLP